MPPANVFHRTQGKHWSEVITVHVKGLWKNTTTDYTADLNIYQETKWGKCTPCQIGFSKEWHVI